MCWVIPPASVDDDRRLADRVQQRRLAVVDVTHDGHHRRARLEVGGRVLERDLFLLLVGRMLDDHLALELLGDQVDRLVGQRHGGRDHVAKAHHEGNDLGRRDADLLGEILDGDPGWHLDGPAGDLRLLLLLAAPRAAVPLLAGLAAGLRVDHDPGGAGRSRRPAAAGDGARAARSRVPSRARSPSHRRRRAPRRRRPASPRSAAGASAAAAGAVVAFARVSSASPFFSKFFHAALAASTSTRRSRSSGTVTLLRNRLPNAPRRRARAVHRASGQRCIPRPPSRRPRSITSLSPAVVSLTSSRAGQRVPQPAH